MKFLFYFFLVSKVIAQEEPFTKPNIPYSEVSYDIPDSEKNMMYYSVLIVFVISAVTSVVLTGTFLVISIFLWSYLKPMKFFWFLAQMTFSAFIVSALNLVFNVPATLFSVVSKEFVRSEMYLTISYLIDYFLHSILFSNLVIALQRFFVFFHSKKFDFIFHTPSIYIWLVSIYLFPSITSFILFQNSCTYKYDLVDVKFGLFCYKISGGNKLEIEKPSSIVMLEKLIQIIIPIVILILYLVLVIRLLIMNKNSRSKSELVILKQAFFIFVMFQIYNIVILYGQTLPVNVATAFYLKRAIHTAEIFAGGVTSCVVFFTSREIRKLITTKVATGSQGNSNPRNRRISAIQS